MSKEYIQNDNNQFETNEIIIPENEEDSSFLINEKRLSISTENRPIGNIVEWVLRKKIIIPNYQRNYVWDKKIKSFFIDSLLLGFPIPSIILFKNKDNKLELIDGKQRVLTMLKYIHPEQGELNGDILEDFILNKSSRFHKKKFVDLPIEEQEEFTDTLLTLTIFKYNSSDESDLRRTKYEIFRRINTGSDKLTNQEIRNALLEGKELELIKTFSQNEVFLNLIKNYKPFVYSIDKNRKHQDEFILRLLAYKSHYFKNTKFLEKNSKQEFINEYMFVIMDEDIKSFEKELTFLEEKLKMIFEFDEYAFYSLRRNSGYEVISNSVFETFSEALYIYSCGITSFNKERLIFPLKKKIYENQEDYKCFFQSTTNIKSVNDRVEVLKEYFEQ